jgi:hypothetical protein
VLTHGVLLAVVFDLAIVNFAQNVTAGVGSLVGLVMPVLLAHRFS